MKRYRWNWRKCFGNLAMLVLIAGTGALIGWIFTMWLGGAA